MAIDITITLLSQAEGELVFEYTQPIYGPDPKKPKRQRKIGINKGLVVFDRFKETFNQNFGQDWDDGFFFERVCRKIASHIRQGEIPEAIEYAA